MSEEDRPQSIQARIAALNLNQIAKASGAIPTKRPPLPAKRAQTTNIPTGSAQHQGVGNQPDGPGDILPPPGRTGARPSLPPRLPPRTPSAASQAPSLPPRRPSAPVRKRSQESIASTTSTQSDRFPYDAGRARAPLDPPAVPALPPRRTPDNERLPLNGSRSATSVLAQKASDGPPPLPRRTGTQEPAPVPERRRLPPPAPSLPKRPAQAESRPHGLPTPEPSPPPIPWASRPDVSKATPQPAKSPDSCMICRDFSAADDHAAKFPRQTVPSLDWLAVQLTEPFPSPTDKARAIFTWLHHNIDYDVEAYFNDRVQRSTPASTLATGLAVCEGYAGLYATLATKAGLESVVVTGHGKGYGWDAIGPDDPCPPPNPTGHAWSAVRIDGGEWKLLDACWGAGHVSGKGQPYKREFNPTMFTMSNEEFALKHFPENSRYFFLPAGRTVAWEDYVRGERDAGGETVGVCSIVCPREGFAAESFRPRARKLVAAQYPRTVHFEWERTCPHWDPIRNGPGAPYLCLLVSPVNDPNRKPVYLPAKNNGRTWWLDADSSKLGRPGDMMKIVLLTELNKKDARGVTIADWENAWANSSRGISWNWASLATWEVV